MESGLVGSEKFFFQELNFGDGVFDCVVPDLSRTTDMGVEMGVPQFHIPAPLQLLPEWVHSVLRFDEDIADQDDIPVPDAQSVRQRCLTDSTFLPRTISVPGILHILDNILTDLNVRLSGWSAFWENLQSLAKLLCSPVLLQRYVHVCVIGTEFEEDAILFHNFTAPALYEKRWHIVVKFLSQLLPRLRCLKGTWQKSKFAGEGMETGIVMGLEAALTSEIFPVYSHMVYGVHKIFSDLAGWLESCPCHEGLHQPRTRRSRRLKAVPCVMRGRSAGCNATH